jgi:hydrogenase maturation factor
VSSCNDDHCITCSDEGKEMQVVVAGPDGLAMCAGADGVQAEVMTELVGSVEPGDGVLVHAGVAIARVA